MSRAEDGGQASVEHRVGDRPRLFLALARRVVPDGIRAWRRTRRDRARLLASYRYDVARFGEFARPFRNIDSPETYLAYIRMLAHSVEKGLALRETRPGFGPDKRQALREAVDQFFAAYGDHHELQDALAALEAYERFASDSQSASRGDESCPDDGGRSDRPERDATISTGREEIWRAAKRDLRGFFASRFSVRDFSGEPVSRELIEAAVELAQKSPSVCNRQATRVHAFDNDEYGKAVLACQNGNRGFGNRAGQILVVTSDLRSFLSVGERNQCWIDGGLFAMSLIYALHSLGLGTCCLNWCVEQEADRRLRAVAGIPEAENVVMLLAVGHLRDQFRVARSPRKKLSDVLVFHCSQEPVP